MTTTTTTTTTNAPAVQPAPGASVQMPTADGALVFSNRANHRPVRLAPDALKNALKDVNGEYLAKFLSSPTPVSAGIAAAISRTRKTCADAKMEWRRLDRKNAQNEYVVVLAAITEDADMANFDARKLAAALIDKNGAFSAVVLNPIIQSLVDAFKKSYEEETGIMDSSALWLTFQKVITRDQRVFKVSDGQYFVPPDMERDAIIFDAALASMGSTYRIRHMPFYAATQAEALRDDAIWAMAQEVQGIKDDWKKATERAASKGNNVQARTIVGTVEKYTDITARARFMAGVLKADVTELLQIANDAKKATLDAIGA